MRRTQRSFYNVVITIVTNALILVTAFAVQRSFVAVKGAEYNAINGLFTSVISMMSLTDLGIGSAIVYHLYRPAEEKNHERINGLLRFYRNSYLVISVVVFLLGLSVMLFLPALTRGAELDDNLYLIFGLFLADCLCSYFLSYKKSLLYAYQMNYLLDGVHFGCYMLQNALQLAVLYFYKNYILFLLIKTSSKYLENLIISRYIHKNYPYTREKRIVPLASDIRDDIIKKVKALVFHKLGTFLVTGSDSLVITGVLGLMDMSRYTNYNMVLGGITALLNKIFETLTSSVGNFLLHSEAEKRREIYKKIDFLNFWLFGWCAVLMFTVFDPVILLWVGEIFLFPASGVFALTLNFYIQGMRQSVLTFKNAAGIYYEDRFVPVWEAVINVILSIFLARWIGIAGVFAGTMISSGAVFLYSYPKYVCSPLFEMRYGEYLRQSLGHLAAVAAAFGFSDWLLYQLEIGNLWLRLAAGGVISTAVFHSLLLLFYGRTSEMRYFWELAMGIINKIREVVGNADRTGISK